MVCQTQGVSWGSLERFELEVRGTQEETALSHVSLTGLWAAPFNTGAGETVAGADNSVSKVKPPKPCPCPCPQDHL